MSAIALHPRAAGTRGLPFWRRKQKDRTEQVPPKGEPVSLERLHPALRQEFGLHDPEPDLTTVLERLRLR